jgi:type I restriction enzyme S subunit
MSWKNVKLEDLTENRFMVDGDWIESKDQDPTGGIRLLQLADIGDGHFIDKSNRFINQETSKKLKCTFLKKNDILIARMPDPLGRACIFPFDEENKYITVVDVCIMRIKQGVEPRYVTYAINSPEFRNKLDSQITGTTRQRISGKNLKKLEIPLPPLATQKRIAEILDAADALRRKDQELLKKYDELAQAIFIDMFGDPVKNEKGWEVKKLKSICKSINVGFVGVCEPFYTDKNNGVPLIRTGNLGEGFLKLDKVKYVTKEFHDKQKKSILQKNDILIARHGDNGKAVLYNADFPEANCLNIVILRLESTSNPIFMTTLLNHDSLRKWISGKIGGATQKVINTKALYDVPVISVNIKEQNNFGNLIKFVENQKSLALQELENTNSLFETLIHKAFNGELVS